MRILFVRSEEGEIARHLEDMTTLRLLRTAMAPLLVWPAAATANSKTTAIICIGRITLASSL